MKKIFSKINFFLQFVVPVIFMAGIIFYLSAQPGLVSFPINCSTPALVNSDLNLLRKTQRYNGIASFFSPSFKSEFPATYNEQLIGNDTGPFLTPIELLLRKSAHFTEYGLLAFFLWRFWKAGLKTSIATSFWGSVLLGIGYAISDESHQLFVLGRSGRMSDIFIDSLGILFVTYLLIARYYRKKSPIKYRQFIWRSGIFFLIFLITIGTRAWLVKQNTVIKQQKLKQQELKINNEIDSEKKEIKKEEKDSVEEDSISRKNQKVQTSQKLADKKNNVEKPTEPLPVKINLQVPFTTQAPFSKWDELHEESCEEASLIMLKYYNDVLADKSNNIKNNLHSLTKQKAEEEIQKLVKYQIEKYGDYFDTDAKITKEIGEDFYGLKNLKIIEKFTIQDLKKELAQGNIILVPTAGRELGNPNFTPPGPLYHNLAIIGYDDKQSVDSAGHKAQGVFITNDPGTRRGQNYKYNQQTLYQAIHDFPGDVNKILEGERRAMVLVSEQ